MLCSLEVMISREETNTKSKNTVRIELVNLMGLVPVITNAMIHNRKYEPKTPKF